MWLDTDKHVAQQDSREEILVMSVWDPMFILASTRKQHTRSEKMLLVRIHYAEKPEKVSPRRGV